MQERYRQPEGRRWTETEREYLRAFAQTFIQRWDCYPLQRPQDGKYVCVKSPLTLEIIDQHLRGTLTIGAYALSDQHEAAWFALDADEEREWQVLTQMHRDLEREGVPTYLELSRRGGHLWFFPEGKLSGTQVRRAGQALLRQYNLEGLELYPRQDVLRTGVGSLMRLPLGIHRAATPPRVFPFVDAGMNPLAPTPREQLALIAHPQRIPLEWVRQTAERVPPPKWVSPTPSFEQRQRQAASWAGWEFQRDD